MRTQRRALIAAVVWVGIVVGTVVGGNRVGMAACYGECENCAADPAFIQAGRRSPEMIPMVREARAKGYRVVEFDDGTTVIIGDALPQESNDGPGE